MTDPIDEAVLAELRDAARAAREQAYAPYSGFQVGAAVLSSTGRRYLGCNVENASYGATLCAERAAVAAMVSAGDREIVAVAVFTDADPPAMPCGICRQVLFELGRDAVVVVASPRAERRTSLGVLLPNAFRLES